MRDGDGVDYSDTNVQEEGVDEPDFVKTDGRRLYVMAEQHAARLRRAQRRAEAASARSTLKGYGHELLVSGDRVLALTTYYNDPVLQPAAGAAADRTSRRTPYPYSYREPATRLFEIDVSRPGAPRSS